MYRIGLAQTDITPTRAARLSGFAAHNEPVHDIYHPLRAAAVAIDDGRTPLLIVSIELLGFYDKAPRVRTAIEKAIGIPQSQIVLGATHAHAVPTIRAWDERFRPLDHAYIDALVERLVAIATEAWQTRDEARLRFGRGTCGFAMSRRRPDPDHPPKVFDTLLPYPQGVKDHDVPVLVVESPGGETRGVIFSYACHPTSQMGPAIGGDYVGFALDAVERRFPGAIPCFLQGCAGDQKPRPADPDADTFGQRTVEQVKQIGDELGDTVAAVIDHGELSPIEGAIRVTQQMVELETEPLDRAALEAARSDGRAAIQAWVDFHDRRIARGEPEQRVVPMELQTIAFGRSLAIVTMACEPTVEHGMRFKRELSPPFDHVLPVGYCNNIMGYVPVARQRPEEGFEVIRVSRVHLRSGPFDIGTEKRIHDAAREALTRKE
jgi:hypothetical protein